MPPKKREKTEEVPEKTQLEQLQADHELFLQAFEKPTQIYRYLRTRSLISPILLQRTLSYMKHHMSRNNATRASFQVDSLLERATNEKLAKAECIKSGFMNLIFLGFYDSNTKIANGAATIEVIVVKICHKKRKEVSSPSKHIQIGSVEVPYNPDGSHAGPTSAVSVPSDSFNLNNGHSVKSYTMLLRATAQPSGRAAAAASPIMCNGDASELDEPPAKKLRRSVRENGRCVSDDAEPSPPSSSPPSTYGVELTVYNKLNRCQLSEGDYEITLQDLTAAAAKANQKKTPLWETIAEGKTPDIPFEEFSRGPVLKFKLCWSTAPLSGQVPLPKPFGLSTPPASNSGGPTERKQAEGVRGRASRTSAKAEAEATPPPPPPGVAVTTEPVKRLRIFYHFLYGSNMRQQTEARDDLHCPWCSLNCMQLYSLLKHLKLCHSRFTFTYVPHAKGARIEVAINDCYDGSYTGNPQTLVDTQTGYCYRRNGPVRRSEVTQLLVIRPKRQAPSLSEFLEPDDTDYDGAVRPYISGHNKLYYHTDSNRPVRANEEEVDSDDEVDPDWLRTKTIHMIDEFSDVNEGEKELTKLWNLHILKHQYIADCQIFSACQLFIEEAGREVLRRRLYRNFVVHLTNLCDFGLLKSYQILTVLRQLDRLKDPPPTPPTQEPREVAPPEPS